MSGPVIRICDAAAAVLRKTHGRSITFHTPDLAARIRQRAGLPALPPTRAVASVLRALDQTPGRLIAIKLPGQHGNLRSFRLPMTAEERERSKAVARAEASQPRSRNGRRVAHPRQRKTFDGVPHLACPDCREWKPETSFPTHPNPPYRQARCERCHKKKRREYEERPDVQARRRVREKRNRARAAAWRQRLAAMPKGAK